MVARNREHGPPQAAQKAGRLRELFSAPAVAQIATRDHELGPKTLDQNRRSALDRVVVACSEMEVGEV